MGLSGAHRERAEHYSNLAGSGRRGLTHYTGMPASAGIPEADVYWGVRSGFPEPCGRSGHQPSPKHILGSLSEAICAWHLALRARCRRIAACLSQLRVHGDDHQGCDASRRQLLAVHGLRRYLERVASGGAPARETPVEMTSTRVVRQLRELIAALDRRMPQVLRAGEASIARDAAALRARALKRIEALERQTACVEKA